MAEAAPNPTSATPAATPAAPAEPNLTELLVEKDETAAAETAAQETPAAQAQEAGEGEVEAAEETPAQTQPQDEGDKIAKPAAGTPDKALQQFQQDLSAATRKIEELQAKVDAGEKLTPKEKEQVQASQRKLDIVRAALKAKGKEIDLVDADVGEAVAQSLIDADSEIEQLRNRQAATEAELAELKAARTQTDSAALWDAHSKEYPGVAVQEVWKKAQTDAMAMTGITAEQAKANPQIRTVLENAAGNLFHSRAAVAAKSVAGKQPAPKKPTTPTTRSAPPVTPGGARVATSSGVSASGQQRSEDAEYLESANALVIDD